MNSIFYFRHQSAFVALAPGQFCEIVTLLHFENEPYPRLASINFQTSSFMASRAHYERPENGYAPSTYEEYTQARYKAQAATAEFFGEYQQFQAPPTALDSALMQGWAAVVNKRPRPLYIDRPNCHHLVNDLPL